MDISIINEFTLKIDYDEPLNEMIESIWMHNWIDPLIFSIRGEGVIEVKSALVGFDPPGDSSDADVVPIIPFMDEEMEKRGLSRARIEHLLAFAAQKPELQEKRTIFSMGSSIPNPNHRKKILFPVLDYDFRFITYKETGRVRGINLTEAYQGYLSANCCRFLYALVR